MSGHFVVVIPERAGEMPDDDAVARATTVLDAISTLSEIETTRRERIELVHAGDAHEPPCCPRCETELTSEWLEAMDAHYDDGRFSRGFAWTTPCCGVRTTLHAVMRNAGLSRFELRARNENGLLHDGQIADIAQALGMPIRVVYEHL